MSKTLFLRHEQVISAAILLQLKRRGIVIFVDKIRFEEEWGMNLGFTLLITSLDSKTLRSLVKSRVNLTMHRWSLLVFTFIVHYWNNPLVLWFLFILSSGFGLPYLKLQHLHFKKPMAEWSWTSGLHIQVARTPPDPGLNPAWDYNKSPRRELSKCQYHLSKYS